MHNNGTHLWQKKTWEFPLLHEFDFTFGLSLENAAKASTIVPWFFQDNALIDYENIKTNPLNADWATVAHGNTMKGSYVPKVKVTWTAFIPDANTEIEIIKFNTLPIHTAMLNRLDAFDHQTAEDIETIIELQHETTDEQAYPVYNTTKLFESQGARDMAYPDHPGLTSNGQLEGVAFDKTKFFQAKRYYTNKEMLNTVTGNMRTHQVSEPLSPHGRAIVSETLTNVPGLCKYQHPYTFFGGLFHLPQADSLFQFHDSDTITDIEALTFKGHVYFAEYNDDFNFSVS